MLRARPRRPRPSSSIPLPHSEAMSAKPRILVARAVFPETLARLAQHFEVESNQADALWSRDELAARLSALGGKRGG